MTSTLPAKATRPGVTGNLFDTIAEMGHEQLVLCSDPSAGYRGIIAIHSTTLGPALGGTRFWSYASDDEALIDALRLARGMTYKNAVAGLNLGGGKSVIIGDNRTPNREMIFRAHGRFVESLGGRYVTAEDVGTSTADMDFVHMETDYVAGLAGRSGDPSPVTAHGVFRAIQACASWRWGSDDLTGKSVAVQGAGHVGYYLCRALHRAGAQVIITDIDAERVRRVVKEFGARAVEPGEIYGVRADVFAPCALGGILNDATIPQLKVEIVAGAANNQLLEDRHGDMLERREILYAPDYVANSGGVINVYSELAGWDSERSLRKADEIYQTLIGVFEIAKESGIPTYVAADRMAERRLKAVGSLVRTWPQWPNKP
ncbi:MAG TPA: Glu/Leu/Phe/Val dehydrogenase [Gemmatimonadaceae bacterium]|nr:Glu/Leu/Phe/Val dehydrogenase [Gemmatimonadaceae bacterium]